MKLTTGRRTLHLVSFKLAHYVNFSSCTLYNWALSIAKIASNLLRQGKILRCLNDLKNPPFTSQTLLNICGNGSLVERYVSYSNINKKDVVVVGGGGGAGYFSKFENPLASL
jgi:hypothetical protein